jgi:hypothetical protein
MDRAGGRAAACGQQQARRQQHPEQKATLAASHHHQLIMSRGSGRGHIGEANKAVQRGLLPRLSAATFGNRLAYTRQHSGSRSVSDCRASAILARAQRREVRPKFWASLRSEKGLPTCTLSRYAATAASLSASA